MLKKARFIPEQAFGTHLRKKKVNRIEMAGSLREADYGYCVQKR